jgi:hypothetical protein
MHGPILVGRRVLDSRVARLARLDVDGRPHIAPITFVPVGGTAVFWRSPRQTDGMTSVLERAGSG